MIVFNGYYHHSFFLSTSRLSVSPLFFDKALLTSLYKYHYTLIHMQNNSFSNRSILCDHKSSYYEYVRVTKCRPITHTSLQENNISLPIVGDRYSCTRTRNIFASLIMIIGAFVPPQMREVYVNYSYLKSICFILS